MNVILFGATGMVGQGALTECLEDPRVTRVLAIVRRPTGRTHPKLEELVHADFRDYDALGDRLDGYDACLFCLGVSAVGTSEADYRAITRDYTLAAAEALLARNPGMAFVYVTGVGTGADARQMWARVKGETENALLAMPFRGAYMFRPGYIQPVKGAVSSTAWYRGLYVVFGFLYPLLRALGPGAATDSATLGRAMIRACAERGPSRVVDVREINTLGAA